MQNLFLSPQHRLAMSVLVFDHGAFCHDRFQSACFGILGNDRGTQLNGLDRFQKGWTRIVVVQGGTAVL